MKHFFLFLLVFFALSAVGLLFFPTLMFRVVGIEASKETLFLLRVSGAGVSALVPGIWLLRFKPEMTAARAIIPGIIMYLVLSSAVDLLAYLQKIVNFAALPSILFRLALAGILAWHLRTASKS